MRNLKPNHATILFTGEGIGATAVSRKGSFRRDSVVVFPFASGCALWCSEQAAM
jgi:hypothetical protein